MIYKIINKVNADQLVFEVNEHLKEGWTPAGGIAVFDGRLYQALIKTKEL